MFFLSPLALLGLAAALVPPLLHLFQRREPPVVEFPALRYLQETKRDAQRTVRLQHLLLMILRMLAVVLLVLAAARPVVPGGVAARHEPTALVLVFDHSLSSGAVQGGTRVLDDLAARARETLRQASAGDAVWLIGAEGIARRGTREEFLDDVTRLAPTAMRLDLAEAVRQGARLIDGSGYARGEIHVLSDFQRSALPAPSPPPAADSGPTHGRPLRVLVYHPAGDPPVNRGAISVRPIPDLWLPGSGAVRVRVGGGPSDSGRAAVSLGVDGRAGARALAATGGEVELAAPSLAPGWHTGAVSLDADELRADDARPFAVRVAAPAVVLAAPADETGPFLHEALGVLAAAGRVRLGGGDVRIGSGTSGARSAVVLPPADPAAFGALNRGLEAAGIPWRYGSRREREDTVEAPSIPELAGARVRSRWTLEPTAVADTADVLARAGGDAWIVRTGGVVLIGSRLVPDETTLPLTGAFVPFVGALVGRLVRGDAGVREVHPGAPVSLEGRVTALARGDSVIAVRAGAVIEAPTLPGVWALRAGTDTAGMLVVAADARESDLTRADAAAAAAAWPGADVTVTDDARQYGARRFRGAGRSELTGLLLLLALLVLVAEALLAAGRLRVLGLGS